MFASFTFSAPSLLAWTGAGILTTLLSVVVFIVGILLVLVILIQDSKDTGLTSAFGGASGGGALLGARMQKELARITTILAVTLSVSLLIIGFITAKTREESVGGRGANPLPAGTLPGADQPVGEGAVLPGAEGGSGATTGADFPVGLPGTGAPGSGTTTPAIPTTPAPTTPATPTPAPAGAEGGASASRPAGAAPSGAAPPEPAPKEPGAP